MVHNNMTHSVPKSRSLCNNWPKYVLITIVLLGETRV